MTRQELERAAIAARKAILLKPEHAAPWSEVDPVLQEAYRNAVRAVLDMAGVDHA